MSDTVIHVHASWDAPTSKLIYSGEGDNSFEYEYEITNCLESADAYFALLNGNGIDWFGVPGFLQGCLLRTITMAPNGPLAWKATCSYAQPSLIKNDHEKLETIGQFRISFSSKSQTLKQYTAKTTTSYAATGDTAPDFKGAINVNAEGEVDGVESVVPSLTITVTQRMEGASLTPAYALVVAGLIGHYNNNLFGGFPAGTLQLTAGDGSLSQEIPNPNADLAEDPIPPQDRELSFEFLYSPNLTGISIGTVTGISKLGHQYMWTLWRDEIDAGKVFRKPRAVYVQDLYGVGPVNFALLRLGV